MPLNIQLLKLHSSFSTIILKFIGWLCYYVCWCNGAVFALGLVYSHKLVDYSVVALMITYLIDSSGEPDLKKASFLVNIQNGTSAFFVLIMTYISRALFPRPKVIICSTIFTITGLILLYLTALGKVTRSLSFQFNIIGVLLIAVGEAGVRALLREFIANQLRTHEPKYKNEDRVEARTTVFWRAAWCFSVLTTYRIYNSSWPTTFIFSASATAVTLIFFLCSIIWFYRSGELAASGSDSASAIRERLGQQGQEMECYKHQNKPKVLLNVIPMWTSFLVFYLIVSTGETFFPEQGDSMRSSSFYVTLLVIQSVSSKIISFLFNLLLSKWVPKAKKKHATLVRIWAGMVLSTLVCAVTWRVEVHRLIIVNISKGLLTNNPDAELPMSIFWLAPQFCLLGLMEGLAEDGLEDFMIDRFPLSWREYVSAINELLFAIGSFISILCVHANRRLFGSTLNSSRLDEYYKRLTVVSFVNLCYYWYCIYTFYTRGPGTDVD